MIQTIFIIYAIIPIIIFIKAITAIDKRIRRCRCRYAIPAFVLICVNLVCFYDLYKTGRISFLFQLSFIHLFSFICLFFVLLFYKIGIQQERTLIFKIICNIIQNCDE